MLDILKRCSHRADTKGHATNTKGCRQEKKITNCYLDNRR